MVSEKVIMLALPYSATSRERQAERSKQIEHITLSVHHTTSEPPGINAPLTRRLPERVGMFEVEDRKRGKVWKTEVFTDYLTE